jgi:hypothetical protein
MEDRMRTSVLRWPRVAGAVTAGICALCLAGPRVAQAMPIPAQSTPAAASATASAAPAAPAAPAGTLAAAGFTDSFGTAVDEDPSYGLNDSLNARQSGARGVTYTRVSNESAAARAPRPWYSQVHHVNHPGVLSFWLGSSAIRMDAPVVAGPDGTVGVQATMDPVTGDTSSADWSSLALSRTAGASGWVASSNVAVGVLVRSTGGVQVYQGTTLLASRDSFAQPGASGQFVVTVTYAPGQKTIHLTVNGTSATITAPVALPASATLFLGARLGSSTQVSTLSDLETSGVNMSGLTLGSGSGQSLASQPGLRYYGYYAARLGGGVSHLAEIAGRSNLNWVTISDASGYGTGVATLAGCAPGTCVVNTGFEFFSCDSAGNNCHLYANYAARWAAEAAAVRPYLSKIAAFYMLDEPQWHGATPAAISTSAELIKQTFPGVKVMMIEAGPKVTSALSIPASVDWIGFDWYCQPFTTIQAKLSTLEALIPASSPQRFFLVPEDAPLPACAGVAGHTTDASIAALQQEYFNLAQQNPRVVGLMNFGFWTSPAWTAAGGTGASELPLTVNANERVAARILAAGQ